MADAKYIVKMYERLRSERSTRDRLLQEISDLGHPSRANFTNKRIKGEKRSGRIYDTTAMYSANVMANGLHGMLMGQSTRWFFLMRKRVGLGRNSLKWLQNSEDGMYDIFSDSKTGFHSHVQELLMDEVTLGTSVFQASLKSNNTEIHYQTRDLAECYLVENSLGVVDGLIRKFDYTTQQILERWSDKVPEEFKEKARNANSEDHSIIHAVLPRSDYMPGNPTSINMPWMSVYILVEQKTVLQEGGFKSFPFMTPRWNRRSGEVYGTSPMQNALPNMKTANTIVKETLEAAQKLNRPPLQLPDNGFVGPIRSMAGGLNYYRAGSQDRIEPLNTGANPEVGITMLERTQHDIERMFYTDAFMMTDDSNGANVKAQFVIQRREERFRQLSPLITRFQSEFMDPLIMRTFELATDIGVIDDAPDELLEKGLDIGYVSPIARAQKKEDSENIMRLMEIVAPFGEVDPAVWNNFNPDEIVRHLAKEVYNIPVHLLRTKEEVDEAREQNNQKEQMEALIQNMQGGAAGLKDASTATKNATGA